MDKFNIDGTKIQYHVERVNQWLTKDPISVFPIYVEVSPVGACNFRCSFCAVDYIGYKNVRLDKSVLMNTLTSMAENGVRSVMFGGEGEPTLYRDLPEMINHAKDEGLDISITTNGTGLSTRFISECLFNLTWIKVSLNAGTKETYAKIHRTDKKDWDLVWKNISESVEAKRLGGYQTTIGVQAILLPENASEMKLLVAQARSIGVDYVVIKPYSQHLSSITKQYEGLNYADYETLAEELAEFNTETFHVVFRDETMAECGKEREYGTCYSTPYFWAYIQANGDVYGCSAYLLDERFKYGNVNEQTFKDIWLGDKRKTAIENMKHLDVSGCRINCRMNKVNQYLWGVKHPESIQHRSFI